MTSAGKGYCVELLEHGELLGVAVGGSREALLDHDYTADWGNRQGFAKVALLTGIHKTVSRMTILIQLFRSPHHPCVH